jgi:hypothetical protein
MNQHPHTSGGEVMSGKISAEDIFITVGAFILVLGLYQRVRPVLSLVAEKPEESENDMRSHRWTKKYGCRKLVGPDGKWSNYCTGIVDPSEGVRVAPPLYSEPGPSDYDLGQSQEQSSEYARAYDVTRVVDVGEHLARQNLMTVDDCSKIASKRCCSAAAVHGFVDLDSFNNCKFCNHPSCDDYQASGPIAGDPTQNPFAAIGTPPQETHITTPQEILATHKISEYACAYAGDINTITTGNPSLDRSGPKNVKVYDCDRPFELNPYDMDHINNVPPKNRAWILNGLKKDFADNCAQERNRRMGGVYKRPGNFRNLDPSKVHPHYPMENVHGIPDTLSEYARAYRVTYY